MVDDELRIASNIEAPDPELDGNPQPIYKSLILCDIVRGHKMNTNYVLHVNAKGRDEEQARTRSCLYERPVEVQCPELCLDLCWGELGVAPFYNKIRQHL